MCESPKTLRETALASESKRDGVKQKPKKSYARSERGCVIKFNYESIFRFFAFSLSSSHFAFLSPSIFFLLSHWITARAMEIFSTFSAGVHSVRFHYYIYYIFIAFILCISKSFFQLGIMNGSVWPLFKTLRGTIAANSLLSIRIAKRPVTFSIES